MEQTDEYKTITDAISEGFYSEKRSKFLAFAIHVTSEEEVKETVDKYRRKYYDARHVCYAYVLGPERTVFRANDDGEPSSTAGKPIMGQINRLELTDVLVIVVRYYGGVNLGTGGLIVAYRTAAANALDKCEIQTLFCEETIEHVFPYIMMDGVMRVIRNNNARILSQKYDNTCEFKLSIKRSLAGKLKAELQKLSFNE